MNAPDTLNPLEKIRVAKLRALEAAGIVCFPERFERSEIIEWVRSSVAELTPSPLHWLDRAHLQKVALAGRIIGRRRHGDIMFLDIKDQSGTIQIVLTKDTPISLLDGKGGMKTELPIDGKILNIFDVIDSYFDIWDFIGFSGWSYLNQRSQATVVVDQIQLLTKSISTLPDKHHGLKDQEDRFRRRYLDMLDPEVHARLVRRSKYFSSMRRFLEDQGFLELDTPRLENTTGGADARPFETYYNAFDTQVFLRISAGELWQKRLMAGGFEKTFEIWPVFRNEWVSAEHAQDYMQMEVYWAYADYNDMMGLVKNLYKSVIDKTYEKRKFSIHGHEVDFDKEWETLDYAELIRERTGIDIFISTEEEMVTKLRELWAHYTAGNRPRLVDYLWKFIRKTITWPAFLINEPKFTSPLAKSDAHNPDITHRFHVIIAGSEVWNGYSELNDPIDQLQRFDSQQALRDAWDDEAQMADYEFVDMLKHGMPPTAWFGVSERLFAFLEWLPIRECQTFPYVRRG